MSSPSVDQHGPWQILKRHSVYQDPWMTVRKDDVIRPDGLEGIYSTVRIKPGVCVIPLDRDGSIYLTKEFHYAVGRDTVEGISGGIEAEESAEDAALRELQEEVGVQASRLRHLGWVDPLTAALSSPTQLFCATELQLVDASPEGTEQIQRIQVSLDEAIRMVMDSEITHGPTCTAILKMALLR
jgi:ADP-ribose pyrophosphatase